MLNLYSGSSIFLLKTKSQEDVMLEAIIHCDVCSKGTVVNLVTTGDKPDLLNGETRNQTLFLVCQTCKSIFYTNIKQIGHEEQWSDVIKNAVRLEQGVLAGLPSDTIARVASNIKGCYDPAKDYGKVIDELDFNELAKKYKYNIKNGHLLGRNPETNIVYIRLSAIATPKQLSQFLKEVGYIE